ncbi:hypothetical protein K502DRAFT_344104 [Neoconidiobolus thromboides FSU 785]|nr:hypothetical protein K502DRAFT_344104 [Neoconidiobolus thromboides FSU 785]
MSLEPTESNTATTLDMDQITLQSEGINEVAETSGILPISRRRKIVFVYNDIKAVKTSIEWCLENIFQYGKDYVTIVDTFSSDPSIKGFSFNDLWSLTAGTDDVAEFENKTKKESEIIDNHIETLRSQMVAKQILSQKLNVTSVDPRGQLLEIINTHKPEFIVIPNSDASLLQRTVYGSLEDYLIRHSNVSVFVVKGKEHPYQQ